MQIKRYVNGKPFKKPFDETMVIENHQISQTINNVNKRLNMVNTKNKSAESGANID